MALLPPAQSSDSLQAHIRYCTTRMLHNNERLRLESVQMQLLTMGSKLYCDILCNIAKSTLSISAGKKKEITRCLLTHCKSPDAAASREVPISYLKGVIKENWGCSILSSWPSARAFLNVHYNLFVSSHSFRVSVILSTISKTGPKLPFSNITTCALLQ